MISDTLSATYNDETDDHSVTLTIDLSESKPWGSRRTYHEVYQSDRKTRVQTFYEVKSGASGKTERQNDIITKSGRLFSYSLADQRYTPNLNVRAALIELAELIGSRQN